MAESSALVVSGMLLRGLPDALTSHVVAAVVNHALRGQRIAARLSELDGHTVCLDIHDIGSLLTFQIRARRLVAVAARTTAVRIRGSLRDFLDLVRRREDPDTLFFQRRLCIEGDVETGLHVKNLIDSLDYDWDAHVRDVLPQTLAERVIRLSRRFRATRA